MFDFHFAPDETSSGRLEGRNEVPVQTESMTAPEQAKDKPSASRRGAGRRGFAGMDPERQRQIASQGGRAAHQQGVAHEWNSSEAAAAGRLGGQASHGKRSQPGAGHSETSDDALSGRAGRVS